jgi:hypothetical protein
MYVETEQDASMKYFSLALSVMLCAGCASTQQTHGRIYSLDDGSVIEMTLFNYSDGFGRASAALPGGEALRGEYTLSKVTGLRSHNPRRSMPMHSDQAIASTIPGEDEPSWAQVYGFGEKADAQPVGTGTLVGDRGTILHIVLYSADNMRRVGDGVARSNAGKWYRVHIGDLQ